MSSIVLIWFLHTDSVLEGSRNKSWDEQAAIVDALATETFDSWEVPHFYETFLTIALTKIATGKSIYQAGDDQNGGTYTYTRVKEATQGHHLAIGALREAPSGVHVNYNYSDERESVGVAARRKF